MADDSKRGGLLLIATPIGNLADVTARAAGALATLDLLLCEDTRVTARLLGHLDVQPAVRPYHDHNADRQRPDIIARLHAGAQIGLVSDAGTPLVNDPGYKLVRACIEEGIPVTALPGPSAPIVALLLSGLPPDRFYFGGFLPNRKTARRAAMAAVANLDATLLFFESARRLTACLADAAAVLGDRPAAVARELTKRYEEVRRDRLAVLAAHYADVGPPKGEIVVVIGGADAASAQLDAASLDSRLRAAMAQASVKDAAVIVAGETGLPRKTIYAQALKLRAEEES